MKRIDIASLAICIMVLMPIGMACISDDGHAFSVSINEVNVHSFDDGMVVEAGSTDDMRFAIYNTSIDVVKFVSLSDVSISNNELGSITYDHSTLSVAGNGFIETVISVDIAKYAKQGEHTVHFTLTVTNSSDPSITETRSFSIPLMVDSYYSSKDSFNKFMGLIPNTLPAPFDSPLMTAAISLLIWMAIAFMAGSILCRIVQKRLSDEGSDSSRDSRALGKLVTLIIVLIGLSNCIRIYGADEYLTGTVTDLITAMFVVIGSVIAWKAYKIILYNVVVKMDPSNRIDDSLIPLFKMIGRIVVCVFCLSSIMGIFGLDLGTIITSAGLLSLAISLGAQNTLNQFFCGIQLMATRPFRIGDKVMLDDSQEVLIVRKIRVMDTEFKNWLNEEVFRVPNSTVMSAMITNITYQDKTYKVYEYIDVDYGADVDRAKDIMLSVAYSHPQVITDGSKDPPAFRFSSMEASTLRLRLSYVVTDHEVSYTASCQIRETIFKKLREEGFKIPHNIVDVHVED